MNCEVIMFNMSSYSEWQQGVVNRNYHIFNYLLRQKNIKRIIAVDFLPFSFKRVIRNYWENIIKGTPGKVVYRDLTTRCVRINREGAELYIFSTIDSFCSPKSVVKKINRIFQKDDQLFRMIYSCFPMFVDYFSRLKSDLTIFDAIDNWIEHPSFVKYKDILRKNYQIICAKSDLIFTVSEGLREFFKNQKRTKGVYWIPNGVDTNHFIPSTTAMAGSNSGTDPSGQFSIDIVGNLLRPIVGYFGTIQERFDFDLLEYLANHNPQKSFLLAGPIWDPQVKEKLLRYKNIYLTGRIPYHLAPDYINSFDVAIIPHRLDEFIRSTYSLKLLEYLSCGRPVVTTPTPDTENFKSVVYRAEKYEDFNQKIDLAIQENSPSLVKERRERVQRESWEIKIGEMMKIINEHLKIKEC